jgi:signal peptidase I
MAVLYPIGQAKQALLCPRASVIVVRVNEDHSTKVAPESEATAVPRPVTEQKSRAHTSSRLRNTLSTIGILLLAPIIALLLTAFVFQSYQVDGPSMQNYGDTQDTKQLVKRVIGLPGDHIVIKNSVITVYNNQHPNGFQPDQTLPYGQNGAIPATDNNLDITLSSTQLFVCGDNRRDSLDSRIFGPIETKQVVGKLVARIFPLSKAEKF